MISLMHINEFLKESDQQEVEQWTRRLNNYERETPYYNDRVEEYTEKVEINTRILEELEEYLHFYSESKFKNAIASVKGRYSQAIADLTYSQRELGYYKDCVDANEKNILYAKENLEKAKKKFNEKANENKLAKDIYAQFEVLDKMKQIDNIYYENVKGQIMIDTHDLYINEPITGKRFKLGKATITLRSHENLANNIKIWTNNPRYAYGRDRMYHPHVFMNGDACWGTAYNDLILAAERNDYISIVLTVLLFLQTCDIKDPAGKFVASWSEVDMNNEIIHLGEDFLTLGTDGHYYSEDEASTCDICGESRHPDDIYSCENCDNCVCEDCSTEIQLWDDRYIVVCDNCYDEDYFQCPDCGLYVHNSQGVEIVGDTWVCPHCAAERREENVHPF